jgi:hypothetical protein
MNIFLPNKVRYALWYMLYFTVCWFFTSLAVRILWGDKTDLTLLLRLAAVSYVVALVLLPATSTRQVKFMAITILDEIIAGPSVWVNTAIRFNLKTVDMEKSQRQNIFHRILGYRLIVSTSGQKILFVERAFDKDQVTEILKTIGCADSLAA